MANKDEDYADEEEDEDGDEAKDTPAAGSSTSLVYTRLAVDYPLVLVPAPGAGPGGRRSTSWGDTYSRHREAPDLNRLRSC